MIYALAFIGGLTVFVLMTAAMVMMAAYFVAKSGKDERDMLVKEISRLRKSQQSWGKEHSKRLQREYKLEGVRNHERGLKVAVRRRSAYIKRLQAELRNIPEAYRLAAILPASDEVDDRIEKMIQARRRSKEAALKEASKE